MLDHGGREPRPRVGRTSGAQAFRDPGFCALSSIKRFYNGARTASAEMRDRVHIFDDDEAIGNVKKAVDAMHDHGFTHVSLTTSGRATGPLGLLVEFHVDAPADRSFFLEDRSVCARDVVIHRTLRTLLA